jgi:hypothetical protein
MIGYAQNIIDENIVLYSTVKLHPEYLSLYSSYALFFVMNQYYLNEKNFLYVSDGARSISHETNVQKFLIQKFNFRKAYCRLNIVYREDVNLLIKILFPFRKIFQKYNNFLTKKAIVLLKQEEIRRSFD